MDDFKKYFLEADAIDTFLKWYEAAKKVEENPEAMTLSTAGKNGFPSGRLILYKGLIEKKFAIYTNYHSRKAIEMSENPKASLTFYWHKLGRQVRIEANVEKMPEDLSRKYFHSRGRESQVASLISKQSSPIDNREKLEKLFNEKLSSLQNKEIPYPENWGGFLLKPLRFEFFLYREHRLNDRFLYEIGPFKTSITRLQP
ncbi:MAG: pyridoxamine 5'-phosphate oxidase [Bacteriovoracaceae bacterium]|nr:pyridoxamine 5'-phosphate oxidase [Bacteriovoracaceae bacterium]